MPPITLDPIALLAAEPAGLVLVSPWKPLLIFPFLIGWGWVVSTIYDKDAQQYYLPRERWNLIHLAAGAIAVAVVFAAPLEIFITLPIMVVILAADLYAYFAAHNASDLVPESRKWSLDPSTWLAARAAKKTKADRATKGIRYTFDGPGGVVAHPEPETPEFELRVAAEDIVQAIIDLRASQIDIQPAGKENVYGVFATVDTVRRGVRQVAANEALALVDFFKGAAGLDVQDRRRKQRGTMRVSLPQAKPVEVLVSAIGSSAGVRLTLLVEPAKQVALRTGDLGLHEAQREALRAIIDDPAKGVVLLAGKPDQGRTTTMYSVLRDHDAYTSNVQTIEFEPQSTIEGVRHNIFDPQSDAGEFSTTVRSILRRDPDVVAIAELPDEATAQEIARADVERSRVYVSVRVDDPIKAIQLFCQQVGDQKAAAKALRGVIAQRLVRRLCDNCKVPFQPTPEALKKLGLPPEVKQLHRKSGKVLIKDKEEVCPVCSGSGYFGVVGAYAVHQIDDEMQRTIAVGDFSGLKSLFRQRKQFSVQQAALQHVVNGTTSIEEVARAFGQQQPSGKAAGAQPATAAT